MQSVTIGANQAGQRLDKFLHKYLPLAGNGFLYKMLRKKNITLNGKKAEGREILALQDQVTFFLSDETIARFSGNTEVPERESGGREITVRRNVLLGEYMAAYDTLQGIRVLYEDEDCLIVNKPAGILTQKASPGDLSVNEWLTGYLLSRNPDFAEELPVFRPSVCNRLDRNTSGIVLCGKSLKGLQYLGRCIKEHTLRKYYRTICVGALEESGAVEGYLQKDASQNRVTVSGRPRAQGEEKESPIRTVYTPLKTARDYTLLEVELITGKSHQIRAHLAGMGHPLIGDFKYGNETVNVRLKKRYGLEHQLLHAGKVVFPEKTDGPDLAIMGRSISAPVPDLFFTLEKALFPRGSLL